MPCPRLKVFILPLIVSGLLAFPQNIIGCGPMMDPYDYFTTFFSKQVAGEKGSNTYYYTNLLTFYDDWNDEAESPAATNQALIEEWQQYVPGASTTDVTDLVYKRTVNDMKQLAAAFGKPTTVLPTTMKRNSMAMQLLQQKKADAVHYLVLAKTIEPICVSPDPWIDAPKRDSAAINKLINQATAGWQKASDAFLKNKYAFLRCKLAFYNNRMNDCIRWYNEGFGNSKDAVVKTMALSYSAGAQYRLGKGKEAAYAFSKTFAHTPPSQRKAVFLGFLWATHHCDLSLLDEYCNRAENKKEKAMMAAMFGLWGYNYHLPVIEKVYSLDAQCELLPLLALREINKVEERYLTPMLDKQPGSKAFYFAWSDDEEQKTVSDEHVQQMINLFATISEDKTVKEQNVFATATAYLHYLKKDVSAANSWLAKAEAMPGKPAVKNQQQMIGLLLQTASLQQLNPKSENELLPRLTWLQQMANTNEEFAVFYRNLLAQVIAPLYYKQGDVYKTVLAYGLADRALPPQGVEEPGDAYSTNAVEYLQNQLSTPDVVALYNYLNSPPATAYDAFLLTNNAVKKDQVVDMLGTTYLREFDFEHAIDWLKKQRQPSLLRSEVFNYNTYKSSVINVNPFHDYLNDYQRYEKPLAKPMTKLAFAQKMLGLQQALDTASSSASKSKLHYQIANGYYNMSYYGNSWKLVSYFRSNINWNTGVYNAPWEKEYFGVEKAKTHFLEAYKLSANKEQKAAAYFLAAKCAQRQVWRPEYDWNNYDAYEANLKLFQKKFHHNAMFATFQKEFGSTQFYQRAYNTCSYLRDFVRRNK